MIFLTLIIAIAGKGGVGKSTFSSLLIKNITENKDGVILAVDADSNSTLGQMLGVRTDQTIGNLREDLLKEADNVPPGMSKFEFVQYQLRLAMAEGDKFDLITMGRPEGPGCYCYINNILRTFLDALSDKYSYVVIDNEAGMEHLSRRTTRAMDKFFIVTDYTPIGFETAERIRDLSADLDLNIKEVYLIINRVPNGGKNPMEHPKIKELNESQKYSGIFSIPNDETLIDHAFAGKPVLELPDDSVAAKAVAGIAKKASVV